MRNFIIFFREKTGTSPLVRLLEKFDSIMVVHQKNHTGFEPFDRHNCGRMTLDNLQECLDIVFSQRPVDNEQLNRIYTATSKRPLDAIGDERAVGFKMRFTPPNPYPFHIEGSLSWNRLSARYFREHFFQSFKKMMFDTLRRHGVVVLLAIRQDVFRLALSKYHGDGTGKQGHLQFKLARGEISKNEIGKIYIDCQQLAEIIAKCEALHEKYRRLMAELKQAGNEVYPVLYEDFVTDKRSYLERLFKILELDISSEEISKVLGQEEYYKKVHSDDISEFVENHEEVINRFGDRFVSWR